MYYPILRGKQNELLALRELVEANVLGNYTPIIEPVKNNFFFLIKAIEELNKKGIEPVVIVNPDKGDFKKVIPYLVIKIFKIKKVIFHSYHVLIIKILELRISLKDYPDILLYQMEHLRN